MPTIGEALKGEKAILDNAQRQFERTQSLVSRGLTSQESLEAASDALARARLTVTTRQRGNRRASVACSKP